MRKPRTIQIRTVYKSERIEVTCAGPGDYSLFVDDVFVGCYRSSADAEHAGALRLHEEAAAVLRRAA